MRCNGLQPRPRAENHSNISAVRIGCPLLGVKRTLIRHVTATMLPENLGDFCRALGFRQPTVAAIHQKLKAQRARFRTAIAIW